MPSSSLPKTPGTFTKTFSTRTMSAGRPLSARIFVRTFYSGIDVPPAARERCSQPLDLDRNFYNVVLVASIEHRKGQDIFIQAYANLPPEIQAKMRCYLIGRHIDHISVYHKYYQKVLKAIRALPD